MRVNCVSPGLVRTEGSMQAVFRGSEELAARAGATTAVGRVGEPEDVARTILWLASPEAGWITGTAITVDGGFTVT